MDNREIDRFLRLNPVTSRYYLGSFSCDNLPPIKNYPCTFVLNLDDRDGDGVHWAAVFIPTSDHMFYFDSYGIGPNHCEIDTFQTRTSCELCTRNIGMFQREKSDACGYYTCYVIYQWSMSVSLQDIVRHLSQVNNSDLYVKKFVRMFDSK